MDCVEDLVKAVKNAKRALNLQKKSIVDPTTKKAVEKTGKAIVKSALASKNIGASSSRHGEKILATTTSPSVPDVNAPEKGSQEKQAQEFARKRKTKDVSTIGQRRSTKINKKKKGKECK